MNEINYALNNRVFVAGTVTDELVYSHELFGETFFETQICVPRLSEHKDLLPLTVSERLIEGGKLSVGARVAVNGQFRSYNKIVDDKSRLMLTIFARDITLTEVQDANPNTADFIGYVCKPPIFRTTPFNREICDLLIAVNRAYNKSDYIPCIAWGRNARFAKAITVGRKIRISGRIQSREYTKKLSEEETEKKTAYEISVNQISLDEGMMDDTKAVGSEE